MGKLANALIVLLWSLYSLSSALANEGFIAVHLQLQNQYGQPLKNAVVELLNSSSASISSEMPVAVMDQINKQFLPEILIIQMGQAVIFPNSDNVRHHVYSFSPSNPFELKLYAGRPKEPIVFKQPGVVVLGCNIHDAMVGYIFVTSSHSIAVSDAQGDAHIQVESANATLLLWHPHQTEAPEYKTTLSLADYSLAGPIVITLPTQEPAAADTFEAQFRNAVEK